MTDGSLLILSRLQQLRVAAKTKRRGHHKGGRMASRFGSSLEFSDFRLYQPGDDVRQIDWNVYGRTQKHYIKRFLDEQEVSVTVFLDVSGSMQAIDAKWQRAKELAAAFSYIALANEDRLSFIPVSAQTQTKVNRKGAVFGKSVYFDILKFPTQKTSGVFTGNVPKHLLKNNQIVMIISDGLEVPESFEQLFRDLAAARQEVKFIQLLSRQEMEPDYHGDLKLIDSETKAFVNVSMTDPILIKYQKHLAENTSRLEQICRRFGFTYLLTVDDEDLQRVLFHDCTAKRIVELR
jgi:hypothetical protein